MILPHHLPAASALARLTSTSRKALLVPTATTVAFSSARRRQRAVLRRFSAPPPPPMADATPTSAPTPMTSTSAHYNRHTASSYESAYFYSPGEYTEWLSGLVRSALRVDSCADSCADEQGGGGEVGENVRQRRQRRRRRLVDIGGGTGNFTRMIVDGVSGMDAVVVDPFLEGSGGVEEEDEDEDEDGAKEGAVRFVRASAEDFAVDATTAEGDNAMLAGGKEDEEEGAKEAEAEAWWRRDYDQILMKEVVHHLDEADRTNIFRGMRLGLLAPNSSSPSNSTSNSNSNSTNSNPNSNSPPSILIITRPHLEIDYPLFPAAREVWSANQPPSTTIVSNLIAAGFTQTSTTLHSYPCSIQMDKWCDMVRGRFWSTFSEFTDEELEVGCEVIRREAKEGGRVDEDGVVRFEDRLVFITAK